MTDLSEIKFPRSARYLLYAVLLVGGANYLVRLFSVTVFDFSRLHPVEIQENILADSTGEFAAQIQYADAILECIFVNLMLIAASLSLYVFVFAREIVRWIRSGRTALTLTLRVHLILAIVPVCMAYVFWLFVSNMESIQDTRLGSAPPAVFMFAACMVVLLTLCVTVMFVLDAERAQRAMDHRQRTKGK